jgi:hypothetical protein
MDNGFQSLTSGLPNINPAWKGWIMLLKGWKPHSLNPLLRMHRMQQFKVLNLDKSVVMAEGLNLINIGAIPKATGRRQVELYFTAPRWGLLPDGDNALKGLADGLKACGLILDDNFRSIRWGSIDGGLDPGAIGVNTYVFLSNLGPALE